MNVVRTRVKNVLVLLLLAIVAGFIFASVFVYYPVAVTLQPINPPVYFEPGINAGQPDLLETIDVSVGTKGASLRVAIHPTYQTNVYKSVAIVRNVDTKAYNIYVRVAMPITPIAGPSGGSAIPGQPMVSDVKLCFVASTRSTSGWPTPGYNVDVGCVSLQSTGTTLIGSLNGGGSWEVDLYVYIPEGAILPSSVTAEVLLIYTPSAETPP